ncbi:proteinase inhibitor I4 serpin [Streptomyces pharetrae CZA14]|uniref:Proteinase inhibitor I4 serpin n=1 Tax=Streptomyces pharetrae CZA14 TaxID=1144883 RepID=A0ABX3YMI9_9ACTN|nr:proteinase inhibitor I4 serpin [Streptomyces pharetrae CZA14]
MRVTNTTIRAVNRLTARWARTVQGGTVFSAPGVWPLLALLADGAGGAARDELADAVGLPAEQAAPAARELLAGLAALPGLETALGLWTARTPALREAWRAGLPGAAHGVLTGDAEADRAALDAWAAERTGGLVRSMPVPLSERTELVLACALAMRTRWLRPFEEGALCPEGGPWRERSLVGLWRRSEVLDRVGVADTAHGFVTELKVLGGSALDVHLLLGEEHMTPGQVLTAGVDVLARRCPVVPGPLLPYGDVGPGLSVVRERSERPRPPVLEVTTPAYAVSASHDLLKRHALFGLTTARDDTAGHFPGISTRPLAVGSAEQAAVARFGALGFAAAAVTAFGPIAVGLPRLRWRVTTVEARYDRPFGFLAVHRHTRLVLAAGWVTDPEPFREDEEDH